MLASSAASPDPRALYVLAAAAAKRVKARTAARAAETDPILWLEAVFPTYVPRGFASFHAEFWRWFWAIRPGERSRPFVGIWPRGFAKSTSAELACAAAAALGTRRYGLLVCETQEQADDHVANVAGMLESPAFALAYPDASARSVNKYGNSKGWRRNRLRTRSGFTLDAIGLDTAARGVKLDEARPDVLIFDDLDGKLDSPATTEKKLTTLTHTLIPARADHAAVLACQNLVIPDGIFARLADGRADFLADRIVSGPHPALRNAAIETVDGRARIVAGEPTWEAMGIAECQAELDEMGLTAWLAEKQHEVEAPAGGMFDLVAFRHCRADEVPDLVRVAVWVDPAVTDTDQSDAHGIQADGLAPDRRTVYRLRSWEARTSPEDAMRRAILWAAELGADTVGVETDQGGDTWRSVFDRVWDALVAAGLIPAGSRKPRFKQAKAGAGHGPKTERASRMLAAYERGEFVHVIGTHETLERALRRFPRTKPFDLVDGSYWSWFDLTGGSSGTAGLF